MRPLVRQRRGFDCGIAALAGWLHLPYEDVYVAAVQVAPKMKAGGLYLRELEAIAAKIGRPLTRVHPRRIDFDEDDGVLGLVWRVPKDHDGVGGHWVILRHGTIIDPAEPSVWDVEEYLEVEGAKAGYLLVDRASRSLT